MSKGFGANFFGKELQLLALIVVASPAFGAAPEQPPVYRHWIASDRSFECEIPSDWKSISKTHLSVIGKRSASGVAPGLSVIFYAKGGSLASADDYIAKLGKWSEKPTSVLVGGISSKQFEQSETRQRDVVTHSRLDDPYTVRERSVLIQGENGFWVLEYSADVNDYKKYAPHFERLLSTFKLKPAVQK